MCRPAELRNVDFQFFDGRQNERQRRSEFVTDVGEELRFQTIEGGKLLMLRRQFEFEAEFIVSAACN